MTTPNSVLPLFRAIENRDIETATEILNARPEWIAVSEKNTGTSPILFQPLHCAALDSRIVRLLLERGALVNALDIDNNTPLHYAARYGETESARLLLAAGANINAIDRWGMKPVHAAVSSQDDSRDSLLRLLQDYGSKIDLYCAIALVDLHAARQIVDISHSLSSDPLSKYYLSLAVTAATTIANPYLDATESTCAQCKDLAGIIEMMIKKGASTERLLFEAERAVKLNNTIIAECLLGISSSRGLLTDSFKQSNSEILFYNCGFSPQKEFMINLLLRHGFTP